MNAEELKELVLKLRATIDAMLMDDLCSLFAAFYAKVRQKAAYSGMTMQKDA